MECRIYEINFLISLGWAERELLHNTSLSLALGRPPWPTSLPSSFTYTQNQAGEFHFQ